MEQDAYKASKELEAAQASLSSLAMKIRAAGLACPQLDNILIDLTGINGEVLGLAAALKGRAAA